MTINRRDLALSTLAVSALAFATPAFAASADEDAVAKRVEAFRLAQIAADPKALGALCAEELSYSHSSGKVEDKAAFIANATDGKSKFLSIEYKDPTIKVVGPAAIVRFHWLGEQEMAADGKKSIDQPSHPDELAEARRRVEALVAGGDEVVITSFPLSLRERVASQSEAG